MCLVRKLPHATGKILTLTLILGWKPVTRVGPDYNQGDEKWPSSPKGETVGYLGKDTPTSKDGRKSRALRTTAREGGKAAPGGVRSARTPEGPRTGVTSFERLRRWGADDSRLQEGGRHSPCAARPAAVRPTPAVKVPSGPLPEPHGQQGPRLPLRMWEGGLHGIPPHGPDDAASPRRPGRAWGRVPCRRTQASARPPPPRPAAPTSNVLRPSVPARRSTGHAAARGTMGLVVPVGRKPRSRVWLSSYESRAHSPEVT